jgi:hypothetical protein
MIMSTKNKFPVMIQKAGETTLFYVTKEQLPLLDFLTTYGFLNGSWEESINIIYPMLDDEGSVDLSEIKNIMDKTSWE